MLDELREKLNQEAEALNHELNVELPKKIEEAADHGDLSENAEYDAAKDRMRQVRARLDHISRRLSELSKLDLDTLPTDRVGFGSMVRCRNVDTAEIEEFKIALGDFIDLDSNDVSMESPIGDALMGQQVGDEIVASLPGGQIRYEIVEFTTLPEMADEHTDPGQTR